MNPSSHCRTSIFEEEFKFLRRDIHIHIATQNILTFLSKWHFVWKCKYGGLPPDIWSRNTFRTTSLCTLGVHRQFELSEIVISARKVASANLDA